jgi:hypothetical protein
MEVFKCQMASIGNKRRHPPTHGIRSVSNRLPGKRLKHTGWFLKAKNHPRVKEYTTRKGDCRVFNGQHSLLEKLCQEKNYYKVVFFIAANMMLNF